MTIRALATVATVVLVAASAVAPDPAAARRKPPRKPRCPVYVPVEPNSNSTETAEALEAPVILVTDALTEAEPYVTEYEHGPAVWDTATQTPIIEDTRFFNIQVISSRPSPGLYVRQEWPTPSLSDMDLLVYDASGARATGSGSANLPQPLGGPGSPVPFQSTGAQGFESVSGYAPGNCAGLTIESRAFMTRGEDMTLRIWIGEPSG